MKLDPFCDFSGNKLGLHPALTFSLKNNTKKLDLYEKTKLLDTIVQYKINKSINEIGISSGANIW